MEKAFSDDIVDHGIVLKIAKNISDVKSKLFIQAIEERLMLEKLLNADQMENLSKLSGF